MVCAAAGYHHRVAAAVVSSSSNDSVSVTRGPAIPLLTFELPLIPLLRHSFRYILRITTPDLLLKYRQHGCPQVLSLDERAVSCDLSADRGEPHP